MKCQFLFMYVNKRMCLPCLVALLMMVTGVVATSNTGDFPVPVQTIQPPENLSVSVQVNQDGSMITASFRGGFGQTLLKDIEVELIMPDGTTEKKSLSNSVGDSVTFAGSGCGDQVIGTANFMNGYSYPVLNEMMENIPGLCAMDHVPAVDPCAEIAASPYMKVGPIEEIPKQKSLAIQANVDISTIDVEFRGGFGQNIVKEIKVTRIAPDGAEETKMLGNAVGDTVSFKASNGCLERIVADAAFMDGTNYRFYDQVLHISRSR